MTRGELTDECLQTSFVFIFLKSPTANMFSGIPFILAVPPHKLYNAERKGKFSAVRRQALLPHSLIEINRFSQCSVLTVHHCSIERIHQNQPGALHSLQPKPTSISELLGVQGLNMTVECSTVTNSFRLLFSNRWSQTCM